MTNLAILIVALFLLALVTFGLVALWDSIRPVAKHPELNNINWPVKK